MDNKIKSTADNECYKPCNLMFGTIKKLSGTSSKYYFQKYGANQQAISLATKPAEFKIKKDKEAEFEWDLMLSNSNWELLHPEIEKDLYINSTIALGFTNETYINSDGNLERGTILIKSKPLLYTIIANRLIYLLNIVDKVKDSLGIQYLIIEEWAQDSNQVNYFAYKEMEINNYFSTGQSLPTKYDHNQIKISKTENYEKFSQPKINYLRNIPFEIIHNRFDKKSDLDEVSDIHFHNIDISLESLGNDLLASRTYAFLNESVMSVGAAEEIQQIFKDPSRNVIRTKNFQTSLAGNGVTIAQGQNQSNAILNVVEKETQRIKEFGFMKLKASDSGRNNKQTAEIANMNSDYEDMIETKANLRENQFRNLVMTWKYYEKDMNNKQFNFTKRDVEVNVMGSTKWLTNQANEYSRNQDGAQIQTNTKITENIEAKE